MTDANLAALSASALPQDLIQDCYTSVRKTVLPILVGDAKNPQARMPDERVVEGGAVGTSITFQFPYTPALPELARDKIKAAMAQRWGSSTCESTPGGTGSEVRLVVDVTETAKKRALKKRNSGFPLWVFVLLVVLSAAILLEPPEVNIKVAYSISPRLGQIAEAVIRGTNKA